MIYNHDYIKKDLEYHRQLERKIVKRLNNTSEWDGCVLNVCRKGDSVYYYACRKEDNKLMRKYLGKADGPNARVIKTIQRRHFLKKELVRCQNDINALNYFLKHYSGISPDDTISRMGKAYTTVADNLSDLFNIANNDKWVRENTAIKESYPPYYPNDLIHSAPDGTKLRSKSEIVIYVELQTLGIPFVYELPRRINGILYHPDFTIINKRTKELILIEYMGKFREEQYREDNAEKIYNFFLGDFVLGKNFFIFMDDAHGHLDGVSIRKILESIAL